MSLTQPPFNITDLHPGFKFHHYHLLEQIGTGGQGVVWSAEDTKDQQVVAIKFNEVLEGGAAEVDDLLLEQELGKLVQLRQTHILSIHDYGMIDQVRYLVSPYIGGGSLYDAIGKFPMQPADALRYAAEIASALDYLHENYIIHRDLKPANVLLDLTRCSYLADFGLARTISITTQAMHTGRGTPPYAPPEQHKQLAITASSDLYSFGIMLFEMFTGRLPWNGEKILGMQQLYTNVEMPDPCEINPNLSPQLKDILRELTSSDPSLRPVSASEVVGRIADAFQIQRPPMREFENQSVEVISSRDAQVILEQKLSDWKTKNKQTWLSPTRFAMVHMELKRNPPAAIEGPLAQFLLYHSIVYAAHDQYWWQKTSDPRDQAAALVSLLERRNDLVATRVLAYLLESEQVLSLFRSRAGTLSGFLLDLASKAKTPAVSAQLLSLLQLIISPARDWNDAIIPAAAGAQLGKLALQENDCGSQALQLISRTRSKSAVEFLIKNAGSALPDLLSEINQRSGNLPATVSGGLRTRLLFDSIQQQLTIQPARLVGAYVAILLGSILGIGLYAYLAFRLPEFLDLERISTSLIRGVITGFVFSLGILLARLVTERFEQFSFSLRLGLGVMFGTLFTSMAIFLFQVLFVNTMPSGLLIPAGCLLIAFSFSLGRLVPWRILRMALSSLAIFAAISGTSWLHRSFATFITDLTPLFQFEDQWSFARIGLIALLIALIIGVPAHLVRLDPDED